MRRCARDPRFHHCMLIARTVGKSSPRNTAAHSLVTMLTGLPQLRLTFDLRASLLTVYGCFPVIPTAGFGADEVEIASAQPLGHIAA